MSFLLKPAPMAVVLLINSVSFLRTMKYGIVYQASKGHTGFELVSSSLKTAEFPHPIVCVSVCVKCVCSHSIFVGIWCVTCNISAT